MATDEILRKIETPIRDMVISSHPGVVFTNFWLEPSISWCGNDMLEVWAVYDGRFEDLGAPAKPSLAVRIHDLIRDSGLDACPSLHLITKEDAEELFPETV